MSTQRTSHTTGNPAAQLSLFEAAPSSLPDRFRLDDATRRRGMRHVARIRAQLEARYPSRSVDTEQAPVRARTPIGSRVGGKRRAA